MASNVNGSGGLSFPDQIDRKRNRAIGQKIRWGPREIDIDILLFGDVVMNDGTLAIPHAEMVNRKFVLQPLAEIAPETVHPAVHKTSQSLARRV